MKTRRRGGMEPKDLIRRKQIEGVQTARQNEMYSFGHRIGTPTGRKHWAGPSAAKLDHLRNMVSENARLRRKGKGRSRTRRN